MHQVARFTSFALEFLHETSARQLRQCNNNNYTQSPSSYRSSSPPSFARSTLLLLLTRTFFYEREHGGNKDHKDTKKKTRTFTVTVSYIIATGPWKKHGFVLPRNNLHDSADGRENRYKSIVVFAARHRSCRKSCWLQPISKPAHLIAFNLFR